LANKDKDAIIRAKYDIEFVFLFKVRSEKIQIDLDGDCLRGMIMVSFDFCEENISAIRESGCPLALTDTAAEDIFNGAWARCLADGMDFGEAVRFANAVGALTVTKQGAIPSLPILRETQKFLKNAALIFRHIKNTVSLARAYRIFCIT
jgi:ribokinase